MALNPLGLNNLVQEEKISKIKAIQLFDNHILDNLNPGTFETLQFIHRYLFEDIYDFAGEIRTVNLAKGNFRFAPVMYLKVSLENIEKCLNPLSMKLLKNMLK